jgi:hypothetical protein
LIILGYVRINKYMKILLIGDYSAFHKNLAIGLRMQSGVTAHVASSGDGFKGYSQDIIFGGGSSRSFSRKLRDFRHLVKWFNQYDIIQLINVGCLDPISIIYSFFRSCLPMKAKLFCLTVGCDYQFWTNGRKNLNIPLFDEVIKKNELRSGRIRDKVAFEFVNATVEGFIGCYEYYEAYADVKKRLKPILHPIDLSELTFNPPTIHKNSKLILYHGVQKGREGFKGSYYINDAFEKLNKKYPNDLNCIIKQNLPYKEYLSMLDNIHVLLDQTNCISHGMNSLIGMAMGKIVGCGSQNDLYFQKWLTPHCIEQKPPIFPILPDTNQIISQIENLLETRENLVTISNKGREYVEKYHDCKIIAEKFLKSWSEVK